MEQSINRMRIAIWALVAYQVIQAVVMYGTQKGLWEAVDSLWRVI